MVASNISKEEREAIDRAIAEGRVQKIPTGQSAYGYTWDKETGKLALAKGSAAIPRFNMKRSHVVSQRMAFARRLIDEKKTRKEIIQALRDREPNLHISSFDYILRQIGITPISEDERRKEEVLKLYSEGVTKVSDLASCLGITRNSFYKWMNRTGFTFPQESPATHQTPLMRRTNSDKGKDDA